MAPTSEPRTSASSSKALRRSDVTVFVLTQLFKNRPFNLSLSGPLLVEVPKGDHAYYFFGLNRASRVEGTLSAHEHHVFRRHLGVLVRPCGTTHSPSSVSDFRGADPSARYLGDLGCSIRQVSDLLVT